MKKGDKIIAILAVVILLSGLITNYFYNKNKSKNNLVAIIKQDGKIIEKIDLTREKNKDIKIKSEGNHYNLIKIRDGAVSIVDADCPHSECIKMGSINKPGKIISCIPNKLIIYIDGEKDKDEIDINSY